MAAAKPCLLPACLGNQKPNRAEAGAAPLLGREATPGGCSGIYFLRCGEMVGTPFEAQSVVGLCEV